MLKRCDRIWKCQAGNPSRFTDDETDGTDILGLRTVRCAEMGTTMRSGGGARAPSASTALYAAQATPPPPQLALPAPPARGLRGSAAAPRPQSLAPGGGGGVPFQGRHSSKSRRNSAKHVAKAPQPPLSRSSERGTMWLTWTRMA